MSTGRRPLEEKSAPASSNRHRSTAERRRAEGALRTPETILGERLASIRTRQGLTAEQFAARIASLGGPRMDRATVSRVEGGHRGVGLNEALIFAAALGIAPVNLFVPTADGEYAPVQLTRQIEASAQSFREWVRGYHPLGQLESQWYWTEVPDSELEKRALTVGERLRDLREARRRERVAVEKANFVSERLAALDNPVLAASDPAKRAERDVLDARLDVALDRVAEARVEREDAEARLERAENDARRAAKLSSVLIGDPFAGHGEEHVDVAAPPGIPDSVIPVATDEDGYEPAKTQEDLLSKDADIRVSQLGVGELPVDISEEGMKRLEN